MALLHAVEFLCRPNSRSLNFHCSLVGAARYIAREWWFVAGIRGRDFRAGLAGVVLACLGLYWALEMSVNWSDAGSSSG